MKRCLATSLFILSFPLLAVPKLSVRAWNVCIPVYERILKHPFLTELADGSLEKNRFCYYLKNDSEYLNADGRSFASLAGRVQKKHHALSLLDFSRGAFVSEQETVHKYHKYKDLCTSPPQGRTPALFSYSQYLLAQSAIAEPVVAMGALLPCFWVYSRVGKVLIQKSHKKNPYHHWIQSYEDPEFEAEVKRAVDLYDDLGVEASFAEQEKSIEAFETSCHLEWQFWDDAYHLRRFPQ
jgi:thiaminase/transcriptional activator TenA